MLFEENEALQNKYPFLSQYTTPVKPMERELVGRKNEMRRLMAAMQRPELCNVILLGEAGSGKALTNYTLIPVDDFRGYVPMGDLQIGDRVFDENGKSTVVLGVFPQGKKHVYEVMFEDGSKIRCNDEHLWTVRSRKKHNKNKEYRTMTLRQMMDKGITESNKKAHWYVPVADAVERKALCLPIHPYALGVLLVSGMTSLSQLTLVSQNETMVHMVADLIHAEYTHPSTNPDMWNFVSVPVYNTIRKPVLTSDMISLSSSVNLDIVFRKKVVERRIPKEYLIGSEEQRWDLLRGLMDANGTILDNKECCFFTDNFGLVTDIQELAASLGIRTKEKVLHKKNAVHKRADYCVSFLLSESEKHKLFLLEQDVDKIHNYEQKSAFRQDMAIVAVKDLDIEEDMTCIYVDSPNHLFLAGADYIVTHNTALVQGTMTKDTDRVYLEVDLSKMISNLKNENEMADKLKQLFNETQTYGQEMKKELVLFIDEFHQIVQLSAAAVEVLKPLLADSGTRGIRVIAATTYIEFRKWISPNQPLVERLQRINLQQPDKAMTVSILRNFAERYGVADQFYDNHLFELIYDYTNRYIPANSQPRKSILILDSMIGWHRSEGRRIDKSLLGDVIYETEGVNVAFKVDATSIKAQLDKKVLSQSFASSVIAERLQLCVADLNNKTKPMSSFLFTGSTGVGKGLTDDTIVPVWTEDGSVTEKRNGDLVIGDYVFNRKGEPVKVTGVYHRGLQDIYKVTLSDGRYLYTDSSHLWTYMLNKGKQTVNTYTNSTKELYERGVYIEGKDGKRKLKYWIPMNQAVQYSEADLSVHPYVMGAFLGDGSLTCSQLTLSSSDEDLVAHVADLLGGCTYKHNHRNYNWTFPLDDMSGRVKSKQTRLVFKDYPEVCVTAEKKHIPKAYMHSSIEQRWELVRGLFDTDGSIGNADGGRYNVSYYTTSLELANDVQQLLYSLGVSSTVRVARTVETGNGKYIQYRVNVKSSNENKDRFFWLPRKVEIANRAKLIAGMETKSHKKDYAWIGIAEIELLQEQQHTTCIMVDDEEHLYQAGQYVVSHNTEMTKQLAKVLFNDDRNLIRFDMTEYALPESLERFRRELTAKIWEHPYSIVLLDEIEKACAPVTRILLQVLDDGRLMDENNREVTFTNCYIVITTNSGSEIYKTIAQYQEDDTGSGKFVKKYNKLIRQSISSTNGDNKFPPELLGRIDCIVPFQPLSEQTMKDIVVMKLSDLRDLIWEKHNIKVLYSKDIVDYLVEDNMDTDSDSGGARKVMSKLESEVTTAIARVINRESGIGKLKVVVEGELASRNKNKLESDAYIKIQAFRK